MSDAPTRFVLVHGAWHRGSCWAPLVADLVRRGFRVEAPDMPSDTSGHGAQDYADTVLAALGPGREPVVLVGHSLGGLTVPVAAERLGPGRVTAMVLLAAMTPVPGTSFIGRLRDEPGVMVEGYDRGVRRGEDGTTYWPADAIADGLYRGVADESSDAVVEAAAAGLRPQAWTIGKEVTPLQAWPAARTVGVVCAQDRVADPDAFRRALADVRADVVDLPGGHFPMLTRTAELGDVLEGVAHPDA
ncbi:alpha/beta fold hydrolase [Pseudonocardia endophytica]|uniref:Alpha/beta hydrolase family protein n=1 Tax=Pseudonocardia endophytica TaxID=401976 RepID=A0A4R1HM90_PSEEN|nr:alpha/beta fold hydrolase [Pseudonocardia endophytica]TCK20769.1 alpha/beta hydrolase family protein [Pseudonocardia endophytica]